MAIITQDIAEFDDGRVRFQRDVDDVALRMVALRCINGSAQPALGTATRKSDGLEYSQTFPANQTTTVTIPTNATARLQLTEIKPGVYDGVRLDFSWPAP